MWREQKGDAGNGRGPGGAPFPAACDGGRGCEPDPGDVQGHVVAARRALQRCVRKGRPDTRRRREGAASACAASVRQWTGGARGACKAATAAASPVRRTGLRRATRRTLCDSVPCVRVADRRVGAEAAQVPVFSGLVGIEGQRGQGPAGSVTPTSLPCVSAPPPLLVPRSCVLCRESSTKLTVLCACGQFLPRVTAGRETGRGASKLHPSTAPASHVRAPVSTCTCRHRLCRTRPPARRSMILGERPSLRGA